MAEKIVEFEGKKYSFPENATDSEISSALSEYTSGDIGIGDYARAFMQGLTFGFGEEVEAGIRSAISDKTYEQEVSKIRGEMEKFRKEEPFAAYGLEIAGSIPTMLVPGAAIGKAAQLGGVTGKAAQAAMAAPQLARTVAGGAAGGALYGAGTADQDRLGGAITGGLLGGGISGAAGVVAPKIGEAAKRLISEGVPLTPGQAMGGLPKAVESGLAAAPFLGRSIEAASKRASASLGRVVVNKALAPIGKEIPKNLTGTNAIKAADDIISDAYSSAVENAKISYPEPILKAMKNAPKSVVGLTKQSMDDAIDIIDQLTKGRIGKKAISGEEIKEIDSLLGKTAYNYMSPTGTVAEKNIGRALFKAQEEFRAAMVRQNPRNADLLKAHSAFAQLIPIRKATNKALTEGGEFTPAQLLSSIRQQAPSKAAMGQAPGQQIAQEAAEVIGKAPTAAVARPLIEAATIGGAVTSPVSVLPILAGTTLGSALYSRPMIGLTRTGLAETGRVLRETAPAISGLLAPSFTKE